MTVDPTRREPTSRSSSRPQRTDEPDRIGPQIPHAVALGGGHGLATSLRALRLGARRISAVVSVADDGGSSGRLRRITGLPAPGDLRRCLVALAPDPSSAWAQAFEHRFVGGDLEGHALGNLLIAGLAETTGSFAAALELAADLLGVTAEVVPATSVPVVLKADVDGREVVGQVNVGESRGPISSVSIVPPDAPAPAAALEAVESADIVVIGPGSLFTSVLATCVVPDIRAALASRERGTVYVCNLRPQVPETEGFTSSDHLDAVRAHGVRVHAMLVDRGWFGLRGSGAAHRPEQDGVEHLRDGAARSGVRVEVAHLARRDRAAHDPEALARALCSAWHQGW
jgi:uncharacterized cofD-like protein